MYMPTPPDTPCQRLEQYDSNGNLLNVTYTGTLEDNKQWRIYEAKKQCHAAIMVRYPDFKQHNAALGLLAPAEIAAMKTRISDYKTQCDAIEAEILATRTLDEVWAVAIAFSA